MVCYIWHKLAGGGGEGAKGRMKILESRGVMAVLLIGQDVGGGRGGGTAHFKRPAPKKQSKR
jgi:hypothetical protein